MVESHVSWPLEEGAWLRKKDLNPHKQSQSLSRYLYTIPQYMVTPAGFEPSVIDVKGRGPRPLDEGAKNKTRSVAVSLQNGFLISQYGYIPRYYSRMFGAKLHVEINE